MSNAQKRRLENKRMRVESTKGSFKKTRQGQYYDGKKAVDSLGVGDSSYMPEFFSTRAQKEEIFLNILKEAEFEQMFFFTKKDGLKAQPIPRMVIAQTSKTGDNSAIYRMPGCNERNIRTTNWTPTVAKVRDALSEHFGQEFNHCVVTLYRNGEDSLGFHKDKLLDLQQDSLILSVSFGAPRPILFQAEHVKHNHTVLLRPGSVLAIGPKTNIKYRHAIPKIDGLDDARISLSFRTIATYVEKESRKITGRGSEHQCVNYPFIKSYSDKKEYGKETFYFMKEETERANKELIELREKVERQMKERQEQVDAMDLEITS